jgi:type IV secretion system protein VirB3
MGRAVDTLFVAMTRPEMKWGVPWDGIRANAVLTTIVTVFIIHSPPGFLIGIGVHFALRELCRIDPHFFHRWKLYFTTKARSKTKSLWGGSRLQPSPDRVRSAADMETSV